MELISKLKTDALGGVYMEVSMKNANGEVICKNLDIEDYTNLLKKNVAVKKEEYIDVPSIPGYIKHLKLGVANPQLNFVAWIVIPGQVRGILFNKIPFIVPFPALLARVTVNDGYHRGTKLYALDSADPKKGDNIYYYPYGNCGQNGGCCYGNIKLPKLTGYEEVKEILETWLNGETNNDLYESNRNKENLSQFDLYNMVKGKEEYPKELLVKNGMTYGQW